MKQQIVLLLTICVWLGSCGDTSSAGSEVILDVGPVATDTNPFTAEVSADSAESNTRGTSDIESTDTVDIQDTISECPGGFECPCEENADCDSGICVEGSDGGSLCTQLCVDQCPEGYLCKEWNVGGDPLFICQPKLNTLCRACDSDSDCDGGLCIADASGSGRCATSCDPVDPTSCPGGYTCKSFEFDGLDTNQCVPETGFCPCSSGLIGSVKNCTADNEYGSCFGTQLCTANGWSECDAATPAPELCDGIDNDCNELTDETYPDLGTECDSETDEDFCANGQIACASNGLTTICAEDSPAVEQCDGIDNNCDDAVDEGFPNTDGDALADCIDEDDDNDNDPDISDCEPLDPSISSNAVEICDGIDQDCDGDTDEDFEDLDQDGLADCIDEDDDGDGFPDAVDNCPATANVDQTDIDSDTVGDACDDDDDGDSVPDIDDLCPTISDPQQLDNDKDLIGDVCDPDDDNDGSPDSQDCQAFDASIYPGAPEICDGKDNNCNFVIDEGFPDSDGDQLTDCADDNDDNDPVVDVDDCEPINPDVYPGADELCNGVDDNCNDAIDEGFPDSDDDGEKDCIDPDDDGDGLPDNFDNCPLQPNPTQANADGDFAGDACDTDDDNDGALDPNDCEPANPLVFPNANELCNGIDDNCNNNIDEGFSDTDGDLIADCIDADDDNDNIPDNFDNCPTVSNTDQINSDNDLIGNACDSDDDNDGAADEDDCAPLNSAISPLAIEICDGIDNNCTGGADEGFPDSNNDGIADCATDDNDGDLIPDAIDNCPNTPNLPQQNSDTDLLGDACDPDDDNDFSLDDADCAPTNAAINPSAIEICDGIDNNCDLQIDEGFLDTDNDGTANCVDADDDNDLIPDVLDNCSTVANPDQTNTDSDLLGNACDSDDDNDGAPDIDDCAPTNPTISPFAFEVCDGIDNNCSSTVDENYPDTDADGTADCLDTDDDNDGVVDALDNCPTVANPFQENNDTDFLGNACDADDDNDGDLDFSDCAPLDPGINSNAVELCDGVDNNCVDGIDEGYPDTNTDGEADCIDTDDDGDGILDASDNCVGISNPSQINSDSDQLGDACDEDDDNDLDIDTIDCAPTDPSINSAAIEVCDGVDNNCKNGVDEGFPNSDSDTFADCVDEDDDNDGDPDETDCDPTNGAVSNLGTEVCGNGIDDDCNPLTNCFTAQQGETITDATPTEGTEGAVAFYQYGTPNGASANTGLETVNKALEFLYQDPTDGKYYLMIILDSPGGGGGNVNMTISGAVGANLLVMDDPGEGNPQFNSASGSGTLKWNWVNCCTDGALIGPLTAPFCVTMTMNSYEGLNGVITYSDGIAIPLGSPNVPVTLCANP